jgi:hypothetical protein
MKTTSKSLVTLAAAALLSTLGAERASAQNMAASTYARYAYAAAYYAAQQAPTSQLVATGDAGVPYRYVREDISFDLKSGTRAWTQREAQLTQNAIDNLPIGYLRHARAGGLKRIERQAGTAHVGPIASPATGISPPFLGYIGVGDKAFEEQDPARAQTEANFLFVHEIGHQVEWSLGAVWYVKGSDFTPISWDPVAKIPWYGYRNFNSFATDYALTNPWEDFAEACTLYWYQPDDLKAHSYAKWQFVHDRAFDGVESPASVRQEAKRIRGFVTPQIQSLSSSNGDPLGVKVIHGASFLSMWDGGFTKVRFGGHGALTSMAVSEQTIYASVPVIDAGSQPITVQTGDGTSNAAAFTVNKPWWKFW